MIEQDMDSAGTKPIPAVSAVIIRDGKVLLVRRGRAPALGLFAFPGGRVEPDEALEQAVRREVLEETGLVVGRVKPLRQMLLGGELDAAVFALTVFLADDAKGTAVAGDDAAAAGWFSLSEMEELPVTESTLAVARTLLGRPRS